MLGPKRLLLVEDDPEIREALAEALRMEGFVVDVAPDVRSALTHLQTAGPPAAVEASVDRVAAEFTPALIGRATPVSDAPLVFVTGLYRSGSTMFEQVLAAHPRVTAGGEIEYFMRAPFSFEPADWPPVARGYLDHLARTFPDRDIVTNKRPDSFALLGMLKGSFPNARFVHTVRDPRDAGHQIRGT